MRHQELNDKIKALSSKNNEMIGLLSQEKAERIKGDEEVLQRVVYTSNREGCEDRGR